MYNAMHNKQTGLELKPSIIAHITNNKTMTNRNMTRLWKIYKNTTGVRTNLTFQIATEFFCNQP